VSYSRAVFTQSEVLLSEDNGLIMIEKMHNGFKVSGKLKINNNGTSAALFSNKDLYLIIRNEGESRTYLDSAASNSIDFTIVKIEEGSTLEQEVYWVLPTVKSLKAEQLVLAWRSN
jgi:hypothetical protein